MARNTHSALGYTIYFFEELFLKKESREEEEEEEEQVWGRQHLHGPNVISGSVEQRGLGYMVYMQWALHYQNDHTKNIQNSLTETIAMNVGAKKQQQNKKNKKTTTKNLWLEHTLQCFFRVDYSTVSYWSENTNKEHVISHHLNHVFWWHV